jgi:hypothetical protein
VKKAVTQRRKKKGARKTAEVMDEESQFVCRECNEDFGTG